MADVHVSRKTITGARYDNHSALPTFIIRVSIWSIKFPVTIVGLLVNHSIIDIHSYILTRLLPHSTDLWFGLVRLAHEHAKNHYPRRTLSPKIDPWHTYAQLKKLNGSPLKDCRVQTNGSHCHVCLLLVNLYLPTV